MRTSLGHDAIDGRAEMLRANQRVVIAPVSSYVRRDVDDAPSLHNVWTSPKWT